MPRKVISDHLAALHYEPDSLQFSNFGKRVTGDSDQIGKFSGLDCAYAVLPTQHLCRIRGD